MDQSGRENTLAEMIRCYGFPEPIEVTRPTLPPKEAYDRKIERIWETHWLTNSGELVEELRAALCAKLDVDHVSVVCNGTVGLLIALAAHGIEDGEVVTTPFTFPATPHALHWNRITPVFCDIDEHSFNLDPERIEEHIGPQTR